MKDIYTVIFGDFAQGAGDIIDCFSSEDYDAVKSRFNRYVSLLKESKTYKENEEFIPYLIDTHEDIINYGISIVDNDNYFQLYNGDVDYIVSLTSSENRDYPQYIQSEIDYIKNNL